MEKIWTRIYVHVKENERAELWVLFRKSIHASSDSIQSDAENLSTRTRGKRKREQRSIV